LMQSGFCAPKDEPLDSSSNHTRLLRKKPAAAAAVVVRPVAPTRVKKDSTATWAAFDNNNNNEKQQLEEQQQEQEDDLLEGQDQLGEQLSQPDDNKSLNGAQREVEDLKSAHMNWKTARFHFEVVGSLKDLEANAGKRVDKILGEKFADGTKNVVIKSVTLESAKNEFECAMIMRLHGVDSVDSPNQTYHNTDNGFAGHFSMRRRSELKNVAIQLHDQDVGQAIAFFETYPGWSLNNLKTGMQQIRGENDSYLVKLGHPVLDIIEAMNKEAPDQVGLPKHVDYFKDAVLANRRDIDGAVSYLKDLMLTTHKTTSLKNLGIEIGRARGEGFTAKRGLYDHVADQTGNNLINNPYRFEVTLAVQYLPVSQ